jgi:Xaa-Pro aminopeptidase
MMRKALAVALSFALVGLALAQEPGEDEQLRSELFSASRLASRHRRLLERLGNDAVVIVKQRPVQDAEELEQWRPSMDLLYLTGLRDPDLVLVLSAGENVLFAPPRDKNAEKWRGARLAPGENAAREVGVDRVLPLPSLKNHLARVVGEGKKLYTSGLSKDALVELAPVARGLEVEGAARPISLLRQVKDEAELRALRRAIDVSCAAHVETMRSVAPGRFEYELQATAEYVFRRYGAERQGYASIVGSGPNSCILHYAANRRRIREGDLVCADMGAEVAGYTADVTRTFPASGKFTAEQRRIYEVVLRAQDAAIAEVRPGATIAKVHARARAVIADAGLAVYFPHGTSHWLGLDVHDVGDYTRPFEPGMVLTVEPGIYIPEQEIGVRIEDDVVVTADGCLNLTASAPRSVEAIEKLVQEGRGVGSRDVTPLCPLVPLPSLRRGRLY